MGKRVAVDWRRQHGMDALPCLHPDGAPNEVYCVYRRTKKESPARAEEVHHAEEEGVKFNCSPLRCASWADEHGWVRAMECIRMELASRMHRAAQARCR